jgi:hypothetical protein
VRPSAPVWVVITAKEVAHGCQEEDQESRQEGDEEKEEVTTVFFAYQLAPRFSRASALFPLTRLPGRYLIAARAYW